MTRLLLSCFCGENFHRPNPGGLDGARCPSCQQEYTEEDVARLVPSGHAFSLGQVGLIAAITALSIVGEFSGSLMQVSACERVFRYFGRPRPLSKSILVVFETMGVAYGLLVLSVLTLYLLCRELWGRGRRVGVWPAVALLLILLATLLTDVFVQQAVRRGLNLAELLH